jgi:hypothetical protein
MSSNMDVDIVPAVHVVIVQHFCMYVHMQCTNNAIIMVESR